MSERNDGNVSNAGSSGGDSSSGNPPSHVSGTSISTDSSGTQRSTGAAASPTIERGATPGPNDPPVSSSTAATDRDTSKAVAEAGATGTPGSGSSAADAEGADQNPADAPARSSGNVQTQQPERAAVPKPTQQNTALVPPNDDKVQGYRDEVHQAAEERRSLGSGAEPPRFNVGARGKE